jgi:type I restriction enzyme, S subunit
MAGERRLVAAEEFCASVRDGTHDSPKPVEHGRYLVTSRHITGGRLDLGSAYVISREDFDAINKRSKVDKWDVLISMIGTVGEPCLIKEEPEFAIKNIGLFKSKGEMEGKWLYYYLRSAAAQQAIREQARGTTQQYIPLGTLREFPIPVPENADEMRAVAHILGTLDDKIELNRRKNETLEAMTQALFKSWFVDFDPVRAKAEGSDPGLPKPLADLFPDCLVDSELGEIPEGWEVGVLEDLVEHVRAKDDPQESPGALFHHYSIPAYDEGRQPKLELGESIKSTKWRVPPNTVLVSKLNPEIERVWMVNVSDGQRAVCSTEFLVLEPHPPITAAYVYCLTRSVVFRQQLEGLVTGTSKSHQRVRPAAALALPVLAPPAPVVSAFDAISARLLERVSVADSESKSLAALRDALLPKLVSGDLRVDDAERFPERASA